MRNQTTKQPANEMSIGEQLNTLIRWAGILYAVENRPAQELSRVLDVFDKCRGWDEASRQMVAMTVNLLTVCIEATTSEAANNDMVAGLDKLIELTPTIEAPAFTYGHIVAYAHGLDATTCDLVRRLLISAYQYATHTNGLPTEITPQGTEALQSMMDASKAAGHDKLIKELADQQ